MWQEGRSINNFMKTQNDDLINSHLTQIGNYFEAFIAAAAAMDAAQAKITAGNWQWWYDHWEPRRAAEEAT